MLHTPMKNSIIALIALLLPTAIYSFQTIGLQNLRCEIQLHTRIHSNHDGDYQNSRSNSRTYSKSSLFASSAGKGFGSSTDKTLMSKDDEKRKKTIEGLERWGKSVKIL